MVDNHAKSHNIHGTYATFEEAKQSIFYWWNLNNFEPYYVRVWTKDGVTTFDYGMHSVFYKIYEIEDKTFKKQLELVLKGVE
ncbi:hypothetical protein MFLO_15653 [Listeria floridensis FSL S10-1187]|uniref:Phage protein n=1 Tax=Listeria floridensis FSL S10-1187 TaxID=1265817 RepID=A0ABP3ATL8_9LIST|nr:hypothetical protein [Listeria floridensis]EUJ24336.1 hypothetical protein MFLO_15653 [Listeria floridensis FSL S10-1187]